MFLQDEGVEEPETPEERVNDRSSSSVAGQLADVSMPTGDFEQKLGASVGANTYASVLASGPFGPDEIDNLVVYLNVLRKVLARSEDGAGIPDLHGPMLVEPED